MKKLFPGLCWFLLFLVSCSRDASQAETTPVTTSRVEDTSSLVSFVSFSSELPVLSLPFQATCAFDYVMGSRLDTTVASSFLKPHELPYRRFSVTKDVTALLVLFPTDETLPRLRTYNQQGGILDEQDLKFNPCSEEPGYSHREQYTIQKNFTIVHIDSTTRWRFDAQHKELPDTRKLTVTRRQFKISPNGQINEL